MNTGKRESFLPWITIAILAAQVIVFALSWWKSGAAREPWGPSLQVLLDWGGNNARYTWDGEWWRLVACRFLSSSLLSLAVVGWALFDAGRTVERVFGRLALLAIFLGAAVVTSLGSLAFGAPNRVVTGAGGPTLALIGTLLGYVAVQRTSEVLPYLRPLRFSAPVFVVWLGWFAMQRGIDPGSMAVGLLCGFLLGLIFAPLGDAPGAGKPRPAQWPIAAVALTLLGGAVWTQMKPPDYLASEQRALQRALLAFEAANNKLADRKTEWEKRLRAANAPYAPYAEELERDFLPPWRKLRADTRAVPDRAGMPAAEYLPPMRRYTDAQVRYFETLAEGLRKEDQAKMDEVKRIDAEVGSALAEIRAITVKREAATAEKKAEKRGEKK